MTTALYEAAKILQIPARDRPLRSPIEYLTYLDRGLPVRTVDLIVSVVAPSDATFKYHIIPKATLARTKHRGRLSKLQSELVTRLAEIWAEARRIWKSDDEARAFLYRQHPLLEGRKPVDLVLQSEVGAQLVRDVLARLEHGLAA